MATYDFIGKYKVIGRGFCGWHAQNDDTSSSGGTLEGYLEKAEEGTFVYDARDADRRAFTKLIISGPMIDTKLNPDEYEKFNHRESAKNMIPMMEGAFKTYLTAAVEDETFSGLDCVGVNVYKRLLQKIPGVKVGYVKNGKVEWE